MRTTYINGIIRQGDRELSTDELVSEVNQLTTRVNAMRLMEGMGALEVSALGTFLKCADIPATIDATHAVMTRRMLEAERSVKDYKNTVGVAEMMVMTGASATHIIELFRRV